MTHNPFINFFHLHNDIIATSCKWADFDQDVWEKEKFFLKGKFAYKWQKILLKRKSGLYSDPHPQTIFFYSNENFYNGQISSEKVLTLCSKKGKKKSGFFGSSVFPSGLIQAGLTDWLTSPEIMSLLNCSILTLHFFQLCLTDLMTDGALYKATDPPSVSSSLNSDRANKPPRAWIFMK